MTDVPTREGTLPFELPGTLQQAATYYKIIGDISSSVPRLVVLHGGPGTGHEYLLPYRRVWHDLGIPVVFYDQIGCAASTRLPERAGDEAFWQEDLFVAELDNLIDGLGLRDGPGYDLLGHSWGSRIAAVFAATRPRGLRRLVLASPVASTATWVDGVRRIRTQLPIETQHAIAEADACGNFGTPQAQAAMGTFLRTFFCRIEPFPPPELLPSLKHMAEDTTVRNAIAGPSLVNCTGSFRDWTCIPRLHRINVPTLVHRGEFDTSHEVTVTPFIEHIPDVRQFYYKGAGHMCHLEKPEIAEAVLRDIGSFLK